VEAVTLGELKPYKSCTGDWTLQSEASSQSPADAWRNPPSEARLGGGFYGQVYRGGRRDGRPGNYAVKRIGIEKVKHELEVSDHLRQFPHPCVVRVHSVAAFEQHVLVVMGLCPGPSSGVLVGCNDLHKVVLHFAERDGVMPEANAKRVVAEVFLGMEHAHNSGVILRDIKTQNVGVDAEGHCQLLDFGVSRKCKDVELESGKWTFGCPPGSPQWAAPEIFMNWSYNWSVDFFSLGVLLVILFTGGVKTPDGKLSGWPPQAPGKSRYPQLEYYRQHSKDHTRLQHCLQRPGCFGLRRIGSDPANELALQLIASDPKDRGNHAHLRAHRFLEGLGLPEASAGYREVAEWVAGSEGLRAA